ncbi:MAG: hypothetical protein PHQ11_17160 [Paludibacter sp.]|nr:hypothetical protein [Paludibacter sp.]
MSRVLKDLGNEFENKTWLEASSRFVEALDALKSKMVDGQIDGELLSVIL